ncbi:MAG: hypothetical protein EOQ55_12525 [Mesorhizobium sp.]|uniref:hypothetical protein n=1 Tax=Mesorhizobium sp. TaxID=1871066 RepID=UPI000FEA3692|nr:hypothetical protein [Mesorhizobium sp.]RWG07362.1 MAG: hypothetical protein EOQ54_04515 [Mesorhizobium sp.]RWG20116.1 MAG: hypothetical protein EOQ55_12525 [Mesorhizobium sp.]RWH03724.1 MAG: hypothetical protein EOQ72_01575 [Mesorhizobium sp.]RWI96189.1 MAG: hypothetical protein EOR21_09220 [Mesorhizobium sp.]TIN42097.1 MAG: hypothetical protein E5Y25_17625 [Mesorhizobium sp.]
MNKQPVPTLCHQDAGHLEEAVAWFTENQLTCERPHIPALRRRFGISPLEAVTVLRLANLRQDWGGADADASS